MAIDVWTGPDKPKHVIVSAALAVGFTGLAKAAHLPKPRIVGAAGALLIGIAKEIHDSRTPRNHFSMRDMTANVVGVTVVSVRW